MNEVHTFQTVMNCKLTILTPVHVGAGSERWWKRYMDFTTKGKKVFVFDHEKLLSRLENEVAGNQQTGLQAYMERLSNAQGRRIDRLLDELDINLEDIKLKDFDYKDEPGDDISPLVRTGYGIPILPGSSIKGAIRSVLFNYLWKNRGKNARDNEVDTRMLGSFERAVTRYIIPSDVEIPQTEILNVALFNLQKPGFDWKSYYGSKGISSDRLLTCETFKLGAIGNFRLSIANGWMKLVDERGDGVLHPNTNSVIRQENPIQHLFKFINEYTREHLRKEIAFFEEYREAEHTDYIIHHLYELMRKTENNPRSCVLRMSFGSGYHGITGDWYVEDHVAVVDDPVWLKIQRDGKDYHLKSRRIAKNAEQVAACMGFVELTLPDGVPDIPFDKVFVTEMPKQQQPSKPGEKAAPPKKEAKTVAFDKITDKTVFQAEVVKVEKPFSKVKLLIENYPFEPFAQLSGTKKVQLQPGMIVEVVVNSRSKEGEIKQVTFWG